MNTLANTAEKAIAGLTTSTHGQTTKLFEPTAARCSSSSSTCCVGCFKFR